MGAEQVGFIVVGPVKIPAGRIKAAAKACSVQRRKLLKLVAPDAPRYERRDAVLSETGEDFNPADIPENPEQDIRAFVDWWNSGGSRDTCSRQDPDNSRQKIVYAGEMSWGDEPQGYGYQMLKKAFAWGVAEALGIR